MKLLDYKHVPVAAVCRKNCNDTHCHHLPRLAIYGTCHKLLTFFAELPSRLSAECSAAEYGLPSADRGPFEASRGLPLGRSYYSVQAVERIRYSLDAHLSTQRVKHPQQSLNRYLRPSSCGTALLLVSIRTNSSPNTAQLKDEGVCNYTIRLSTSETNYSNLKAANSNKFVCISITHPR